MMAVHFSVPPKTSKHITNGILFKMLAPERAAARGERMSVTVEHATNPAIVGDLRRIIR
jgi:hypothetical protein